MQKNIRHSLEAMLLLISRLVENSHLGMAISGKNLKVEKVKKIVQEWKTSEWSSGYPPSRLELVFKKIREGTEILMVHSNVPTKQSDEYEQGWIDFYWKTLKNFLSKISSN